MIKKEDLFLKEIESLCRVYKFSYWDVYIMPVPVRKWFIRRWNEVQKSEANQPSPNEPLSPLEKQKMIRKAQEANYNPVKMHDFLKPRR